MSIEKESSFDWTSCKSLDVEEPTAKVKVKEKIRKQESYYQVLKRRREAISRNKEMFKFKRILNSRALSMDSHSIAFGIDQIEDILTCQDGSSPKRFAVFQRRASAGNKIQKEKERASANRVFWSSKLVWPKLLSSKKI